MSSCTTKIRYATRREAQRVRHLLHTHVRPYWCPHHHAWHLGHLPRIVLLGVRAADDVYGRGRWVA